ncbi:transcriptional regulator [Arachnia propionica]|uniref:Transcriptional regulator n=1 Tax=Arachnia propionica TaxID=1750 RepID=A0A3P1T5T6_9ACTN|nr:SRPBCC family protein [Arachnia propionica]MDO5082865.1 SRPBCC family protein [Arachnia propionica]RRD04565.1 transcriptional regulator [Arachnia propionica]
MIAKPYAVVRSVLIGAPRQRVHEMVADLSAWVLWSPWEGRDHTLLRRLSHPPTGAGAWFEWEGNFTAGQGRVEILQVSDDSVSLDVQWRRPVVSEQQMEFRLDEDGEGTRVTWTTHGEISGAFRLVAYLVPMSRIHGPTFTRGLARLKAVCER